MEKLFHISQVIEWHNLEYSLKGHDHVGVLWQDFMCKLPALLYYSDPKWKPEQSQMLRGWAEHCEGIH